MNKQCYFCDKDMVKKIIPINIYNSKADHKIKNIEAFECPDCKEVIIEGKTLRNI